MLARQLSLDIADMGTRTARAKPARLSSFVFADPRERGLGVVAVSQRATQRARHGWLRGHGRRPWFTVRPYSR